MKQSHEALSGVDWEPYLWYQLVNGGEHPTWVLALPRNSWAEMAPPEKDFGAMMMEVLGEEEAMALFESYGDTIEHQRSEIAAYRADLSYLPAPAAE